MSAFTLMLALSALLLGTQAQDIGVATCACQPATYSFKLNFDLVCADRDVRPGDPGIVDTACVLNPSGNENVTDLVPVRVSQVQILELDQNLQVIFQTTLEDNFVNGATFSYSSITQTQPNKLNSTSIPKGIQVFLTGRNAAEQDLVNFWAIVYDNDCGVFPLLEVGQQIGWTEFTDLGDPPQFLCPAVGPAPTEAPIATTRAPSTGMPTEAPTESATTEEPTVSPTNTPTEGTTTEAPTNAPTESPTEAPTEATNTEAPTEETTTEAPTGAPTEGTTTKAPSPPETTEAPTIPAKTSAPVAPEETEAPTIAPVARPPTASPPITGCPPVNEPLPIHSSSGSASSSTGGFRRRHLMTSNTAAPTACLEPEVVATPSPTPRAIPQSSSAKVSKALPKKKSKSAEEQKPSRLAMQKITRGKGGDTETSGSSSSRGAGRRFLMEGRPMW
ncbi:hypothetical protein MPSEU_000691300 [Mayamaea pseudoterrestris]|nr:hypothetical protein MPSEU_000691300 [Mayamaea pseudoterrestris]